MSALGLLIPPWLFKNSLFIFLMVSFQALEVRTVNWWFEKWTSQYFIAVCISKCQQKGNRFCYHVSFFIFFAGTWTSVPTGNEPLTFRAENDISTRPTLTTIKENSNNPHDECCSYQQTSAICNYKLKLTKWKKVPLKSKKLNLYKKLLCISHILSNVLWAGSNAAVVLLQSIILTQLWTNNATNRKQNFWCFVNFLLPLAPVFWFFQQL